MFSAVSVSQPADQVIFAGRFGTVRPGRRSPTLFISSQHPDFDVGFGQLFDGVGDTVLQLVLHRRDAQQLQSGRST